MRRASSLVGLPADDSGGLMADAGVLPIHRRTGHFRSRGMAGKDPKDRRRRRMSTARRRFVVVCSIALFVLTLRVLMYLGTWYPGDETIRASSESFLRVMFSRSGVSFGRTRKFEFRRDVKLDAGEAIAATKPSAVVQGKISQTPRWRVGEDLNVSEVAERELRSALRCFFRVHADSPTVTLYDDGRVLRRRLRALDELQYNAGTSSSRERSDASSSGIDGDAFSVDDLRCSHFRLMSESSFSSLAAESESSRVPFASAIAEDGISGRLLLINSATTLDMLSEYHRPLLNHQAYAESLGYGYALALVKPSALGGRSGKFAKHVALGAQLANARMDRTARTDRMDRERFSTVCHVDLDAWFASWEPFSEYGAYWRPEKDLLFGDAGQIWLNTGVLCARPTEWSVSFFDRVVNAVFSGVAPGDDEGIERERNAGEPLVTRETSYLYGFQRDQPAVWHVLAETWREDDGVPYLAHKCTAWHGACNPTENPIECWHWCHWDALQRWDGFEGGLALAVNALSRVAMAPRHEAPRKEREAFFGSRRSETVESTRTSAASPPRRSSVGVGSHGVALDDASGVPPMHRMCLRSCESVLRRIGAGVCGALTPWTSDKRRCYPADVDKMSLCDGSGCLAQMAAGGGGWIKHTGHQHWRDSLPSCVPVTRQEAERERRGNPKETCA